MRALSPFRRSCNGRVAPGVTGAELEGAGEGTDTTVGSDEVLGDVYARMDGEGVGRTEVNE